MPNHLTDYKTRSWSTYPISMEEGHDLPTRTAKDDFTEMSAESSIAVALGDRPDYDPSTVFYADFEQAAAGHTVHPAGPLMWLTDELYGHPAGKLAWVSYEGLDEDPPTYLLYLED